MATIENALGTYSAARSLCDRLSARPCSAASEATYASAFRRMWFEPVLDPLRPADARDTYSVRRAAMFWGARQLLTRLIEKIDRGAGTAARSFVIRLVGMLRRAVARITMALETDPPLILDRPDFSSPSRWAEESDRKKRGIGSKKHTLAFLPGDWREQIWKVIPEDNEYRLAIAVLSLSPCRPSELRAGMRGSGYSEGVIVTLRPHGGLDITHAPTKTHNGKYGSPTCGLVIDIAAGGPVAAYLASRCRSSGGRLVVSIANIDGLRKYLGRCGKRVFPDGPVISAYSFRAQRLADVKKSFGATAAEAAASAAGHCNDRSQRHYGFAVHGRGRGIRSVHTARKPRIVSSLRGQNFRYAKEPSASLRL